MARLKKKKPLTAADLDLFRAQDWLSPVELGALLGVTSRTIFNMIDAGQIPAPQKWNPRVSKWRREEIADILQHGPKPPGTFKPIPAAPEAPPKASRRSNRKKGG
jgi:predicted DNA-binding transcriptional regulator AlpA